MVLWDSAGGGRRYSICPKDGRVRGIVLANPWLYDSGSSVARCIAWGSLYLWRVRKIFRSANSTSAKNLMEHPYPGNGPEFRFRLRHPRWTKLPFLRAATFRSAWLTVCKNLMDVCYHFERQGYGAQAFSAPRGSRSAASNLVFEASANQGICLKQSQLRLRSGVRRPAALTFQWLRDSI